MIPKIIHYCWFGGRPIPEDYQRYIESWQKFMPEYEIKQWDESNYDVNCIPFSKEAYNVGKYAYVSDYARLRILYEYGGIYFDTDVELLKPLDPILKKGGFMGFEKNLDDTESADLVALGLGFAVEPHNPLIKEAMEFYESHHYIYPDGHIEQITIVVILTNILRKHGLIYTGEPVEMKDFNLTIYPWQYFCPIAPFDKKLEISDMTYTIHHYSASWMSWTDRLKMKKGVFSRKIKKLLGIKP